MKRSTQAAVLVIVAVLAILGVQALSAMGGVESAVYMSIGGTR